jgi:hypothetical protein
VYLAVVVEHSGGVQRGGPRIALGVAEALQTVGDRSEVGRESRVRRRACDNGVGRGRGAAAIPATSGCSPDGRPRR